MYDQEILPEEKIDRIKAYVKVWRMMDLVDWPEDSLGHDVGARHDLWLAGLEEMLEEM